MDNEKKRLVNHLQGQIDRLERFGAECDEIYGALLVILYSSGYLKKVEEHYVKKTE